MKKKSLIFLEGVQSRYMVSKERKEHVQGSVMLKIKAH